LNEGWQTPLPTVRGVRRLRSWNGQAIVKKKERGWNSVLIVLTVGTIGAWLIIGPLSNPLALAAEQIRAGKALLPAIAGIAYAVGFFVTRIVEDAFDAIFSKAPFSDIGEDAGPNSKEKKHPRWIDSMLSPLAYALFLGRVLVTIAIVGGCIWLAIWFFSPGAPPAN